MFGELINNNNNNNNIALGSGGISLSFLYIRQFVAMDTHFVRFFA
jgi:hypothetical protein